MNFKKTSPAGVFVRYTAGLRRYFILAVLTAAVSIFANFLLPKVVGFTVDSIIGNQVPDLPPILTVLYNAAGGRAGLRANLILCAGLVALCAVVAGIFNYFSQMSVAKCAEGFSKNLRDTLYQQTQYLPFAWHTENLTGDIIQRCTSDVETVRSFISKQLIEVVRTILLIVMALLILFPINVPLAAITAAFIPVILIYTFIFCGRVSRQFLKADEAEGDLMVQVQENLTGIRVVRAFGREAYEARRFNEKNDELTKNWVDLGYTLGLYWGIGDIVCAAQLLAVVSAGAYMAASGYITLGDLLVFISYTLTIGGPVRQMGRTLSEMSKMNVSLGRICAILNTEPEPNLPAAGQPPVDGDIVFQDVCFAYTPDTPEVLHHLNFTVRRGTVCGILGATGSGKSSITYLLSRLYEPTSGRITIGGRDIREIDQHHLRRNVGLVLQEPFLFSKTIFENIDITAQSGDLDRVRACARAAAIDDDIMSFPNGYNTIVGERGVTLSGGQKQRIAIARTLMQQTPIMIFDDSMSSLDTETDARVQHALYTNTAGATVLLISHRISTLMHADQILVLENGAIRELGTHCELLEKGGLYRRIYDLQNAGEKGGVYGASRHWEN